jgi:hypothetical protein
VLHSAIREKSSVPYHTVIPLHGIPEGLTGNVPFGDGFVLCPVPDWVRSDSMLKSLNKHDQRRVQQASAAFCAKYQAEALGDPDPNWTGPNPRAIQDSKYDAGVLANLALWLACPSGAGFTVVLHGPEREWGVAAQRVSSHQPLLCNPRDEGRLTAADVLKAAGLHNSLLSIDRRTAMWTVVRAVWSGLQMNSEPVRCILFWVALEAMFGPSDGREITYRLSQRYALYMGQSRAERKELFSVAKRGYAFRSKLVHGEWRTDSKASGRMAEAEQMARTAVVSILSNPDHRGLFCSERREAFLDELAFGEIVD